MPDPISQFIHDHAPQHGPVALMYHAITPDGGHSAWPWALSANRFREHLDLLVDGGWATPTVAEVVGSPERWPGRTAVITFDDGYADNLAACEELQRRGMRATFFMVTGSLGSEPDWPADGRPKGRLLNAAELSAMHAAGMEIGAHGVTHMRLTELEDARLMRELANSKAALQDVLNADVRSFAYPFGDWDERCERAVAAAGYAFACTTRTGWALRDANPYRMRRLSIYGIDTASRLARKLATASNDVSWPDMAHHAWHATREAIRRRS